MSTKLFRNARIHTPHDNGSPLSGISQGDISIYEQGILLCRDGIIKHIGDERDLLKSADFKQVDIEIDCEGHCLIPGFVDPHTHMCFAKTREKEFVQRLRGTPYLEILKQGGGILSSVNAVRKISEDELYEITLNNVMSAMRFGTTTLEIKSGYGLNTETELKMLRVIDKVNKNIPVDIVATFLGAHAIDSAFNVDPERFVTMIVEEMIPAVAEQGIAKFCDVFCEKGVFSVEQSRRILKAAKDSGMKLKMHADEVYDLGGGALAAELKATSADHLLTSNDESIKAMVDAGVIATLLPATCYSLKKTYARAREMVIAGLPIALATDCNPGSSYTESMPFVFGLAVMNMRLMPEEALTAATLNAAYAINMADKAGSLDIGKQADFLLLQGESPAVLAYHAGVSPVTAIYKKGEIIWNLKT
ncbi:MAG: imidazolonepropionase [Desulfobacterales bacterium]|nr:imidazolonepropionase [Desulfobacterales bacterium]